MTRKRTVLAEIKLQMLELMVKVPGINNAEMSRRLGINEHTCAKYRSGLENMVISMNTQIERKITEKIENKDTIWQIIRKRLKIK